MSCLLPRNDLTPVFVVYSYRLIVPFGVYHLLERWMGLVGALCVMDDMFISLDLMPSICKCLNLGCLKT